jgi:hypothetical protein
MVTVYNTYDRYEKCVHKIGIQKPENKEPLDRPRCILDDIINVDLKGTREVVDVIHLGQNR